MQISGGIRNNGANFDIEDKLARFHQRQEARKAAGEVIKATGITTGTGITAYSLEAPTQGLVPTRTPFLDMIPRRTSTRGGTGDHWKQLTALDSGNTSLGVSEGARGASITPVVTPVSATYATLGLEDDYTYEAEEAAQSFDNVPQRSIQWLLAQFRIQESRVIGYGNATKPLGTGNTPVLAVGVPTGTIPAATYVVRIVPLTFEGLRNATVAGGVQTTFTRLNNDGTTSTIAGGSGIASAASNSITTTTAGSLSWTVPATPNAWGYAVYLGTTAANAALAAISIVNAGTLTALATGTQLAASITADNSANSLIYDGLATQYMASGSGAYYASLDGGALTSDNSGGVQQFTSGFEYLWDNYRIRPDKLVIGGNVQQAINKAVFGGTTGPVFRVDLPSGKPVTSGNTVKGILNPITGDIVEVVLDPWAPSNGALALCTSLPEYSIPEVPLPFYLQTRMRDYYQIIWPQVTRTQYQGVYYSGLMKVPALFAAAVFQNIATS